MGKRKHEARMQELLCAPYARVFYKDENGYGGKILEWPGCFGAGPTAEAAMEDLEQAMYLWVEYALKDGQDIPEPFAVTATGRLSFRVPPTLHQQAMEGAATEGISLSCWIARAMEKSTNRTPVESK